MTVNERAETTTKRAEDSALTRCYCCTCGENQYGTLVRWDPACHNHGAHGVRGCSRHGVKSQDCDCGCGYKVEALTDGNRLEQPTELSVEKTVAPKSRTTLRREAVQRGEEPPTFDGADTVRPDEADGIEAVRRYRRERADQHKSRLSVSEEDK